MNDVLDFSKYEVGKLGLDCVEFSLRELVRDVLRPLALRASVGGLAFESVVEDGVPDRLTGDPLRIGQVLRNLAGNAVKFTNQGKVSVQGTSESLEGSVTEGSKVTLCFSVADTGIGVPPEKHRLIFEPFTQADGSTTRKYGGTGLGLSICSGLVELMDGRIWVESEVGSGSTFSLHSHAGAATRRRKPAHLPPPAHQQRPQKKAANPGGGGQQRQPAPGRAAAGARGAYGDHRGFRAGGAGVV